MPASLDLTLATEELLAPQLATDRRRSVVVLGRGDDVRYSVPSATVAALAEELAQRPIPSLRVWVASPGFLAGDWILQAKEGEQTWVALRDQQKQFGRMTRFYNGCAIVSGVLAVGLGYLLYAKGGQKAA